MADEPHTPPFLRERRGRVPEAEAELSSDQDGMFVLFLVPLPIGSYL